MVVTVAEGISIHALLTESDGLRPDPQDHAMTISIHALLTESDGRSDTAGAQGLQISIHALLTESDPRGVRRRSRCRHFNPRSPHGERPGFCAFRFHCRIYFNPRSPHGERLLNSTIFSSAFLFQSTLSSRRATSALLIICLAREISIHALLTESDYFSVRICTNCRISIHALLTESDFRFFGIFKVRQSFQSTLSSRRATSCINCM